MSLSAKCLIVLFALLLEFAWVAWPRVSAHGYAGDPYRLSERMTALSDYSEHQTPENKAALDREMRLLGKHEHTTLKVSLMIVAVVFADVAGIYWLWRYAPKKTAA